MFAAGAPNGQHLDSALPDPEGQTALRDLREAAPKLQWLIGFDLLTKCALMYEGARSPLDVPAQRIGGGRPIGRPTLGAVRGLATLTRLESVGELHPYSSP